MRAPREAGFTLVEVMVALVVAGLVLGAAYGVLGAVAGARARAVDARSAALPGPAARATLDGWLRSAAIPGESDPFVGIHRGGAVPDDALAFTVEDGGVLYPGPRRIRLWVERGRGLLAEVAPLRRGGDPTDTLELARAAAGMRLRFLTRAREQPAWVNAWISDTALPEAVELTLVPAPEAAADPRAGGLARVLRLPLSIPLRANPDASDATERRGT
jgi:prepilin-type N-terminal cleavage/methylation domain-containing protein